MRNKIRTALPLLLLCICCLLILPCRAAEEEAVCINWSCTFQLSGNFLLEPLLDGSGYSRQKLPAGSELTVTAPEGIGGLYIEFSDPPEVYTVLADDRSLTGGEHGYLHEYLGELNCSTLTLRFEQETVLCDLYVLSQGARPDWVQDWQEPWDKADVLLLPTHSDDDQLFFAGVIPWCINQGARVQVAYLIRHYGDGDRTNELLDGLWTSGLRNYPVLGEFRDLGYITYNQTITFYNNLGVMWADFEGRQVELYRRFHPQVVVTHATNGEYGHGAHILYQMVSVAAAELSGSEDAYPESAELYGVWDVPKTYVHNYGTTPILLDLDAPLDAFGGETAYHIAQRAFTCHPSQYNYFSYVLAPETAAGVRYFNPREYGLYRSTVGTDYSGDTFFDNLTLYDEQERQRLQAEAEAEAAEQARLEAERQAEEERRQAEEQARLEAERRAEEERAAEAERQAELNASRPRLHLAILLVSLIAAAALAVGVILHLRQKKNRTSKEIEEDEI